MALYEELYGGEDEMVLIRYILEGKEPPKKEDKKKDTEDPEKKEKDPDSKGDKESTEKDEKSDEKKEGPKDDSEDDGAEEKEVIDDKSEKDEDEEGKDDDAKEKTFGDKDAGESEDDKDEGDEEGDEDDEEAPVTGGTKSKVVIDPPVKQETPEDNVKEEYLGFKKLEGKLSHEKGVYNPAGLAAAIGRKKYGKKGMERLEKKHHKEEVEQVDEGLIKTIRRFNHTRLNSKHLKAAHKHVDAISTLQRTAPDGEDRRKEIERHQSEVEKHKEKMRYHAKMAEELEEGLAAHLQKHDKVVDTLRKLRDRHDERAAEKFRERAHKAGTTDLNGYLKAKAREAFHRKKSRKYDSTLVNLGHDD